MANGTTKNTKDTKTNASRGRCSRQPAARAPVGRRAYGFAPLPFERGLWAGVPRSPKTPPPGVYLASAFGLSRGFAGAMKAGADAARLAMKERARG